MPKQKPLKPEEQKALIRLYRAGNKKARDKLILSNMGCVYSHVQKYRGSSIPIEDLVNEGVMGLLYAIETYDLNKGTKFITHAIWKVKEYVTKAVRNKSTLIRLPVNQQARISAELKRIKDGSIIQPEIAELMDISKTNISFDSPLNNNSKMTYADIIKDENIELPDEQVEEKQLADMSRKLLSVLNEKQRDVLCAIYGIGYKTPQTIKRTSELLNISTNQVKHYRDQAFRKIRTSSKYLDESRNLIM
jgi:RNA polymerase primary sigma factor